jgi:Prokaryotic dksA/traR C4-type zinc finger
MPRSVEPLYKMNCVDCEQPIPEERLTALPDTVRCTRCQAAAGDVPRVRGRLVWEHKTAPGLQLFTPDSFEASRQEHMVNQRGDPV